MIALGREVVVDYPFRPLFGRAAIQGGGRRGKGVGVPFHDAPTDAMRELHKSRRIRYGSCSRRSASDGRILVSDSVGQAVAHLSGIAVSADTRPKAHPKAMSRPCAGRPGT